MKNSKKRGKNKFWLISICIFIALVIVAGITSVKLADSEERPSNIKVVTDEEEKATLLGNSSEDAWYDSVLGIAGDFSIFAKEDVTLTGADSEGKIAAGGTVSATTDYKYQVGTEVEDDSTAKIIAGEGISNLALNFTVHNTTGANVYDYDTSKIAVVGTEASNMNWSEYSEDEQQYIVASDIIDFDQEFEDLQAQSDYLSGLEANGTVIKSGTGCAVTTTSRFKRTN